MSPDWLDALAAGTHEPPPPTLPTRFSRQWLLVGGTVLLFLLLAIGAAYLFIPHSKDDPGRFVAVYVTDLPGGLDKLQLTLAAVTVGTLEDPLALDVPSFELSSLHGPEGSLKIASGTVSRDTGSQISLILSDAQGFKDGAWVALALPDNRLTLPEALAEGDHTSNSVLFDFDLDASVQVAEDGLVFHPTLAALWQAADEGRGVDLDPSGDASKFSSQDAPAQERDHVDPTWVEDLCRQIPACVKPPATTPTGGASPTSPTVTTSITITSAPRDPPPNRAANPTPTLDSDKWALAVTLAWSGGDPWGQGVGYKVFVNDLLQPACNGIVAASCPLTGLLDGTTYRWRVVATDASGQSTTGDEWSFKTDALPTITLDSRSPDGATEQSLNHSVYWGASDSDAGQTMTHRVLFKKGSAPEPTDVRCDWKAFKSCSFINLEPLTTYYWQVETSDGILTKQGPAWSFTTTDGPEPGPIQNPCPPYCIGT